MFERSNSSEGALLSFFIFKITVARAHFLVRAKKSFIGRIKLSETSKKTKPYIHYLGMSTGVVSSSQSARQCERHFFFRFEE